MVLLHVQCITTFLTRIVLLQLHVGLPYDTLRNPMQLRLFEFNFKFVVICFYPKVHFELIFCFFFQLCFISSRIPTVTFMVISIRLVAYNN